MKTLEEMKNDLAKSSKVNFSKTERAFVYSQKTGIPLYEVDICEYNCKEASSDDKTISKAFTEFKNELKAVEWTNDLDIDKRMFKTQSSLLKKMRPLLKSCSPDSGYSVKMQPIEDGSKMCYLQFNWSTNLKSRKMWKRIGVVYLENLWPEGGSQTPEPLNSYFRKLESKLIEGEG